MTENMSIATIIAVVISMLLEWFPALKVRWDKLSEGQKRGIMGVMVAVVTVVVVLGNCYWWGEVCPEKWTATLLEIFIAFLVAAGVQQGVHRLAKKPD